MFIILRVRSESEFIAAGFVYVLINPAMPGLVKVGFSRASPEERARQLRTTGVPIDFVVAFSVRVSRPAEVERRIHGRLHAQRVAGDREFFRVSAECACRIAREECVDLLPSTDATDGDDDESAYVRHASKFWPSNPTFTMAGSDSSSRGDGGGSLDLQPDREIRCPHCHGFFRRSEAGTHHAQANASLWTTLVRCKHCDGVTEVPD